MHVTNLTKGGNTSEIDLNNIFMFYQFYPLASYIMGKASLLPLKIYIFDICNEENKMLFSMLLKQGKIDFLEKISYFSQVRLILVLPYF